MSSDIGSDDGGFLDHLARDPKDFKGKKFLHMFRFALPMFEFEIESEPTTTRGGLGLNVHSGILRLASFHPE
jgi:hypothetical protein